jgi:DNA-binding NarL/FixJ family response regulator
MHHEARRRSSIPGIREDVHFLIVEDQLYRQIRFREWLGYANPNVKIVSTASAAIATLQPDERAYDYIFLDRDLPQSFGESVAEHLAKVGFDGQVYVTSSNPFGAELIAKILKDASIQVERTPFAMLGIFCNRT